MIAPSQLQIVVEGFRLWLSPKESRQLLSCSYSTLLAYRDTKQIRSRKTPGGHYRYWRDDILNLLTPSTK
jgi:predicted site-specific integrase-resolvase